MSVKKYPGGYNISCIMYSLPRTSRSERRDATQALPVHLYLCEIGQIKQIAHFGIWTQQRNFICGLLNSSILYDTMYKENSPVQQECRCQRSPPTKYYSQPTSSLSGSTAGKIHRKTDIKVNEKRILVLQLLHTIL